MPFVNEFSGLPAAVLTTMQAQLIAAMAAVTLNQEYTLNGRHLRRANLPELSQQLADVTNSIARQSRFGAPSAVANFNPVGQSNYPH